MKLLSYKSNTGFTIVELLIVIVVIGILAAITIVAYNGVTSKARDITLASDAKSASTKLEMENASTGQYPSKSDAENNIIKTSGNNTAIYTVNANNSAYCLEITGTVNGANKTYVVSNLITAPTTGHCNGVVADADDGSHGHILAKCSDYTVGDTGPAGGIIYYKASGTCYEVAPAGWNGGGDPQSQWGCRGKSVTPSATATIVGTGATNTTSILTFHGNPANFSGNDYYSYSGDYGTIGCDSSNNGTVAAQVASSATAGGYSDWFLPSKDELNELWLYYDGAGKPGDLGLVASTYWSSSEGSTPASQAWRQNFIDGYQSSAKISNTYVRPVRAFSD